MNDHDFERLRDQFAAAALNRLCAVYPPETAAKAAYDYADAMLKARDAQ